MSKSKNEDMSNLDVVERYETYEDYLDSQLTANDMGYLEDEEMARQLVELGYRGLGDTIRREDFEARKKLLVERTRWVLYITCITYITHSHIHTYTHIPYTHSHTYTHIHNTHINNIHTYTHTHTHTHTHTQIYTHTNTHTHTHTYTHTHTHRHTHIYTHTHIHNTHTQQTV
jgi:hypothetical protein